MICFYRGCMLYYLGDNTFVMRMYNIRDFFSL